jgi:salicylate hydroxylase
MKAIVIGGGIGGLTAALSLLDRGIEVEVHEQARRMTEIGAGLQISANATRVLTGLGLGGELERLGVPARRIDMRDLRSDRPIYSVPLGQQAAERYGGTFHQVHRPDLLTMLVDALPDGTTRLGERATGFVEDAGGVTVHFESGRQARGDVLIGADGIHSLVRRQLLGEQELEFARIVAWRALVPLARAAHLDLPADCHVWLGPGRSAVVYWVHGGQLLNFVGMVPSEEATEESWTATGEIAALRRSYAGCTSRLQAIVDLVETPFITGYYFRYPLARWSEGRVTILGDAAHPMHPFLAQGACQAIEDAGTLAHVLAVHGESEVADALAEYQQRRLTRASRVQNQARTHEHLWHMSDPREIAERNRTLASTMEIDPHAETVFGWLFRHNADIEAARPLTVPATMLKRPEAQRAWRMWATMLQPRDLDRQHHGIREAYDRFLLENFPAEPTVRIERGEAGAVPYVRVSAPGGDDGPVLLHLHGGGYVIGSAEASVGLASRLAGSVGGTCMVPGYREAPEHPYPAAVEDAVTGYEWLLAEGVDAARVLLTGESAGGALAVALAMRLRDLGRPLPAGVVAMCPMADLGITGDTVDAAAGADPISTRILLTQMAATYLQGHDPREPLASPIHGDYRGLPPLLVQVAENEALYADATRMVDAARRDGVEVELDTYPDSVHVFQVFDFLPESAAALARIGSFAATVCGQPEEAPAARLTLRVP